MASRDRTGTDEAKVSAADDDDVGEGNKRRDNVLAPLPPTTPRALARLSDPTDTEGVAGDVVHRLVQRIQPD